MCNYWNHLVFKKSIRQGFSLSPILINLLITDIYNECDNYGISNGDKRFNGGLFADGIELRAPTRSQLRIASEWTRNNEISIDIQV